MLPPEELTDDLRAGRCTVQVLGCHQEVHHVLRLIGHQVVKTTIVFQRAADGALAALDHGDHFAADLLAFAHG